MGLLDNPQDAAMMQLGLGLLSAGGPSRMPVSFGQALGSAGNQAMDAYRQAQQANAQEEQRKAIAQMRNVQMEQLQRQMAQQKVAEERRDAFRASLPEQYRNLPDELLDEYLKASMKPKTPIALGKTLLDPNTYKVLATDETWQQEQQASREAKTQEAQQRQQDRMDMFRMNADLRRDLAGQTAGGKAPAGYRYKDNGDLEVIPGGPADVKAQQLAGNKAAGAADVSTALTTLRDAYDRLEAGGGITSTDNSPVSNMTASASSSALGQALGKAFGTQNQSARNDIAMARPALLSALMKATGMSARQMDSNAELKLWLSTATDPTLDIQANRRALNNIERKYITPLQEQESQKSAPAVGQAFESLPPAKDYKGRRMKSSDGSILRSNGLSWVKE